MRMRALRLLGLAACFAGFFLLASCGTPVHYSSGGEYFGGGEWDDPYYSRPYRGWGATPPPVFRPRYGGYGGGYGSVPYRRRY